MGYESESPDFILPPTLTLRRDGALDEAAGEVSSLYGATGWLKVRNRPPGSRRPTQTRVIALTTRTAGGREDRAGQLYRRAGQGPQDALPHPGIRPAFQASFELKFGMLGKHR